MNEERIEELEMRLTFLDDTVNKLDKIVTHQQVQIEELKKQLLHSHKQMVQMKDTSKDQISDEPPPHY